MEGSQKGWCDSVKGWRRGCLGRKVETESLGQSWDFPQDFERKGWGGVTSKSVDYRGTERKQWFRPSCCRIFSVTWVAGPSGNRKVYLSPGGDKAKQKLKDQKETIIKDKELDVTAWAWGSRLVPGRAMEGTWYGLCWAWWIEWLVLS